ncbi:MAG: CocE/NonD family hydrolase [Thermomicrobiales bacterium]
MRRLFDQRAPMRDGVHLSADVYLPDDAAPQPAILVRTPYDNTREDYLEWAQRFTAHGYPVAVQDCRGRGDSDGTFIPWADDFNDGYDTIAWVAGQPWCDGQVGMMGGSYMAWVQWTAAARNPPALKAMVAAGSPGRWFRDWPYRFGAFWAEDYVEWVNRVSGRTYQSQNIIDWNDLHQNRHPRSMDVTLGRPMPHWQEALDHDTYDDYWRGLSITGYEQMDIPVLHVTGWFDGCAPGSFHHFREMTRRSPAADRQSLLLGAWGHGGACRSGRAIEGVWDLGEQANLDLPEVWLAWFDRWLRGQPGEIAPPVRYFAMGVNAWRDAAAWPPEDAVQQTLFLSAEGALTKETTASGLRTFIYDANDPTPAMPQLSPDPLPDFSPRDLAFLEARSDVLIYTAAPVTDVVEIAGPVAVYLQAASSAPDTDFAAVLADVSPDGRSVFISHGIVRAAYRKSLATPIHLQPHHPVDLDIELADVAHALLPGHALRLIICSCLFPYYHPNPNTGLRYGEEEDGVYAVARQTVLSGGETASALRVYVRPSA